MPSNLNINWVKRLIKEEQEAIDSYERAIAECYDENCIETFEHILKEEKEHVRELEALLKRGIKDKKVKDSIMQEYASIRKRNEFKYGKDFYDYIDKYLSKNPKLYLSDLYYKETEWNKFMDWYNKNKPKKTKDSKSTAYTVREIRYGKPEGKVISKHYSIEGSEEGEIYDNIKSLEEARSKLRGLKKNDKEMDIEQNYTIYRHYLTEDSDYLEEV